MYYICLCPGLQCRIIYGIVYKYKYDNLSDTIEMPFVPKNVQCCVTIAE